MGETAEVENEELENEELEEEVVDEGPDEETIAIAKSMGWVEEENFRGSKSNWVDADKFVDKGMNDLPVLRERVRSQAKKMADLESGINEFKSYHERTVANEYQRAMRDLEEKQLKTVDEGDRDEYQRIQKKKQELAQAHSRTATPGSTAPANPIYTSWKEKNADWFEKDAELTAYANRMSDYIAEMKPDLIGKQDFLDEVDREVRIRFKDKFENTNRGNPNPVESGGRSRRGRGGGKTFNDLPSEAKAACDKFVRRGQITREQYLQTYEWDD